MHIMRSKLHPAPSSSRHLPHIPCAPAHWGLCPDSRKRNGGGCRSRFQGPPSCCVSTNQTDPSPPSPREEGAQSASVSRRLHLLLKVQPSAT